MYTINKIILSKSERCIKRPAAAVDGGLGGGPAVLLLAPVTLAGAAAAGGGPIIRELILINKIEINGNK